MAVSTGKPLSADGICMGIPRSVLRGLVGGCCVYGSLAAVVADDLVDLEDDVFGNL